jgi:vacuolar-type H+-ATPase subunit I/STV1
MNTPNWNDYFASPKQPEIPEKPKPGSIGELLANATPQEAEVIINVIARVEAQNQIDSQKQQIESLSEVNKFMLQQLPVLKTRIKTIKQIISSNPNMFSMSMLCGEERVSLGEKLKTMDYYLTEMVNTFETNGGLKEPTNYIDTQSISRYTATLERTKDRFILFKKTFIDITDTNQEHFQNVNETHKPNPFLDIEESPQYKLILESLNYLAKFVNNLVDLPPNHFGVK